MIVVPHIDYENIHEEKGDGGQHQSRDKDIVILKERVDTNGPGNTDQIAADACDVVLINLTRV